MNLIYLDTSNLSRLARTLRHAPNRIAAFAKAWRSKNRMLAFSRAHLIELLQHADSSVRGDRYNLLASLVPIASDIVVRTVPRAWPVLLEEREMIRHLIARGTLEVKGADANDWLRSHTEIFPERIVTATDVDVLRTFEDEDFRKIIDVARSAVETSTAAHTRPVGTTYARLKVSELAEMPLTPEKVEEGLRVLEEALTSDAQLGALYPLMSPEAAREALTQFAEPLRAMIRRAGEVGMRQAYAEALGSEAGPRDKRYLDIVAREAVFAESVRRVAIHSLGVTDLAQVDTLVSSVSLSDCPGMWLAREVELKIRLAEPEPELSNAYDLDHVSYFPYVDTFFTDKRIAGYVNSVLKQPRLPQGLDPSTRAVAVPDSVEAIEESLPD